jgi:hypothetical protein
MATLCTRAAHLGFTSATTKGLARYTNNSLKCAIGCSQLLETTTVYDVAMGLGLEVGAFRLKG